MQALSNELARSINIGIVLELDRHLRQAEFRQRTHFVHARQTGQSNFDRLRDELFRFFSGKRWNFGVHLNLRGRNVGHSIDGQVQCGPETTGKQNDGGQQDKSRLAHGKFEDFVNHGWQASRFRRNGLKRVDVNPGEQFQLLHRFERLTPGFE